MTRDITSRIASVDEGVVDLLGWTPEEMVGSPSTAFIHNEDQPSAVTAWMEMTANPGSTATWRGRYRTSSGKWKWVVCDNVNGLDDPDCGLVVTTMRATAAPALGLEGELHQRNEIISRLADALPVGLFQTNKRRRIVFTNERLHQIVGVPPKESLRVQFATIAPADRRSFERALDRSWKGQAVDDLEVRFKGTPESPQLRVCSLSVRPLTDQLGTVNGIIGCVTDVSERVALRRDLESRATLDQLTRCLNRSASFELLHMVLENIEAGEGVAVAFIDLDQFKDVNDRFGHAAGDEVLCEATRRLKAVVRGRDHIGRIGGDEFLVICPDVTTSARAQVLAKRLAQALSGDVAVNGTLISCRASVGMAWTGEIIDADDLVARADFAMYESKRTHHPVLWNDADALARGRRPEYRASTHVVRVAGRAGRAGRPQSVPAH